HAAVAAVAAADAGPPGNFEALGRRMSDVLAEIAGRLRPVAIVGLGRQLDRDRGNALVGGNPLFLRQHRDSLTGQRLPGYAPEPAVLTGDERQGREAETETRNRATHRCGHWRDQPARAASISAARARMLGGASGSSEILA